MAKDQASHSIEWALAAVRQWEAFNGWRSSWDMEMVHKINQEEISNFEKALKLRTTNLGQPGFMEVGGGVDLRISRPNAVVAKLEIVT